MGLKFPRFSDFGNHQGIPNSRRNKIFRTTLLQLYLERHALWLEQHLLFFPHLSPQQDAPTNSAQLLASKEGKQLNAALNANLAIGRKGLEIQMFMMPLFVHKGVSPPLLSRRRASI